MSESAPSADGWLEFIRHQASAMRYGSVQITNQRWPREQVKATEKTRLPTDPHEAARGEPSRSEQEK